MTTTSHTWTDTLVPYLARSDEDRVTLRFFEEHALGRLQRTPRIKWLEVGSGPGSKTVLIREYLALLGVDVELLCVEPSAAAWHEQTCPSLRDTMISGDLHAFLAARPELDFDLVTCFHVLYDPDSIDQFEDLLRGLRSSPKTVTVAISVESEMSDFHLMRTDLRSISPDLPLPAAKGVRGMLRRLEIEFAEIEIAPQRCFLRHMDEVRDWLLPFLFGTLVGARREAAVQQMIERFVIERGLLLNVPDTGFILSL